MTSELVPAGGAPSKEAKKIQRMFADISARYDLLNHLLSGGVDIAWREMVADEMVTGQETMILDVACGTGDLTLALHQRALPGATVIGADFTHAMTRLATQKTRPAARKNLHWIDADGLKLPFSNGQFDLLTIAFGIRNMETLDGALAEFHRVLKPGGRLGILEFTQPDNPLISALYNPYFHHVLPRIGALLSQKSAYLYLPNSVRHFPGRRELARLMRREGFRRVRHSALSLGIAAIHMGEKPA